MSPHHPADPSPALAAPQPRLPYGYARRAGVVLLPDEGGTLRLYYRADAEAQALLEARRFAARPVPFEKLEAADFAQLLRRCYERGSNGAMQAMEEVGGDIDLGLLAQSLPEPEDLLESEDDAPIIRLINALLTEAVRENASDIHIEPFENRLAVRFRIDGVLHEMLEPKRSIAPLLVSRIKVMAKLDIAEKRVPQDGRISLRVAGRAVDVRVSTLPSGHGERVVLRLLDKQAGRLDLTHLGMAEEIRQQVDALIHEPHGIFLVTGPTGSGKTTTLYAALSRLNARSDAATPSADGARDGQTSINIMTVEDPIEYFLDGIGQTQVNPKVEMTFARGLRAILRQDPDVVMVGEIRDLETVQIAVQASLTGHLVLSTLHTNTAVGAITRLRDMGVEPFLLSSTLIGMLAQRLVRLLCPHCKEPYPASHTDCTLLGIAPDPVPTLYRPTGCAKCSHTGYSGRTGIYELVVVDKRLRNLIHDGAGEHEIEAYARNHTPGIRDDAMRRVLAGDTSLAEVLRVTHAE